MSDRQFKVGDRYFHRDLGEVEILYHYQSGAVDVMCIVDNVGATVCDADLELLPTNPVPQHKQIKGLYEQLYNKPYPFDQPVAVQLKPGMKVKDKHWGVVEVGCDVNEIYPEYVKSGMEYTIAGDDFRSTFNVIRPGNVLQVIYDPDIPEARHTGCECGKEKHNFQYHSTWCNQWTHPMGDR